MKLLEIYEDRKTYFHGSANKLPLNQVLVANNASEQAFRATSLITQIVEKYKPSNQPSRLKCWFLVDNKAMLKIATAPTKFIYEVAPLSPVFIHYYGWIAAAEDLVRTAAAQHSARNGYAESIGQIIQQMLPTAEQDHPQFVEYIKKYWDGTPVNKSALSTSALMRGGSLIEYTTESIKVIKKVK